MKLQKFGGYAAIASVAATIVFVAFANLVLPSGIQTDPFKAMNAMSDAPGTFYILNFLLMVTYILPLVMVVALHERMHAISPYLSHMMLIAMSACTVITITEAIVNFKSIAVIVPTGDFSAFKAFWAIKAGVDSAAGHACGWACLFAGLAMLRTRSFSRILGWLFIVTGILWIPAFFLIQIGFITLILILNLTSGAATIWTGVVLLRQKQLSPADKEMATAEEQL